MVSLGVVVIVSAAVFALGRYREASWWRAALAIAGAAFVQTTILLITVERSGYGRGDDFIVVTPAFLIMSALVYYAGRAMAGEAVRS